MVQKLKKFRQAMTIKAVGAMPIKTQRGTLFKLGGGIFSKRQILSSRKRLGRIKAQHILRQTT